MAEVLRDSSYEVCAAVNTCNDVNHFDSSHHEYTTPSDVQNLTHINAEETKLPSKKQQRSKRSKRPCISGVVLFLVVLIGSGIATFMVFHYKEQDKRNATRQQQNLGQEKKSSTSVILTTATTIKQFTVIQTTRARTSQTSSILVQGNDHVHQLTSLGTSDFYVRLEKFTGGWAYAKYNNFNVADESGGYRMRLKDGSYQGNAADESGGYRMRLKDGSYQGNAGDSIESEGTTNTNGYKFSTSDIDNNFASASCAVARKGAWWYNECTWANLNGIYGNGSCTAAGNCNFWYSLTNSFSGVKTSFMMVRRT